MYVPVMYLCMYLGCIYVSICDVSTYVCIWDVPMYVPVMYLCMNLGSIYLCVSVHLSGLYLCMYL